MLISTEYLRMNALLHKKKDMYGAGGASWLQLAEKLLNKFPGASFLDYGCGKGRLGFAIKRKLGIDIMEYDPAIEGKNIPPEPADIVMCTDVLEHIEPECIDSVLKDIHRVTLRIAFLAISLRIAKKNLPDGRNAHLIVQPKEWWEARLKDAGFIILDSGAASKADTACYLVRRYNEHTDNRNRI